MLKQFIFLLFIVIISCKTTDLPKAKEVNPPTPKYSADQEIDIKVSDTVTVSGSLVFGGADVLSIIIAGSGPTDRNCNSALGVNTNAFSMLADSMKQAGISTYRYDKRGVGKSTKISGSKTVFIDFVDDANAIINYFKDDFKHISIIGHSEGALIGTLVSQENSNVQSFVNLCGTSISLDSIALEQLERYPTLLDEARLHFEEIRAGEPLSEVNPMLASLFNPNVLNYLKSIMLYNPTAEHAKVNIPALVIGGSCDIQVPEKHAKQLFEVLNSNTKNKYVFIDGMGHLLKHNKLDCSDNQDSYTDAAKLLHSDLVSALKDFIHSTSKG